MKNWSELYKFVDWDEIIKNHPDFIEIQGSQVPYIVFNNEDDVTTPRGETLSERLHSVLGKLWNLYSQTRS